MTAHPALHPTDQTLQSYGLGQLDDATAESVHKHLEGCPDCRRRAAEITSDSFLGRLRDARPQPGSLRPAVSSNDGLSMLGSGPVMPAPPPVSTLPPGLADHPDYEVLRELGRGGMGVVYLAQNTLMGRLEVLKVVGGHLISRPAILERFLREIRSAARLHHPNIVTAYAALRLGESLVLAMEYVEGLDLARIVTAKGPMPVANACNYVHQAALGLQHAHEHGMVHRDIKPANLILARIGNKAIVKVLDFGLAKVTSEGQADSGLTREGQMLGTPDYIAPEQIRDAQSADIRADIYSLGCTLYYVLSGGPPFRGDHLWDVYQAHFSIDAAPLNLLQPEVPVELAALVAKMMAKEPAKRFQEPREVSQALAPFFRTGGAVALARTSEDTRSGGLGSRNPSPGSDFPPVQRVTEATPTRPTGPEESQDVPWTSLDIVGEARASLETAGIVAPKHRPRWLIPSVAVGLLLLAGVVAFATGALTFAGSSHSIRFFNGRDLQGWKGISDRQAVSPLHVFKVEDGKLVWNGNIGRIFSVAPLWDFSLEFEYQVPPNGRRRGISSCLLSLNRSGRIGNADNARHVALLLTDGEKRNAGDIIPWHDNWGDSGHGSDRSLDAARPAGEWNKAKVQCSGHTIRFALNGREVNHVESDRTVVCHPGFLSWGTDIHIRNVVLAPVGPDSTSLTVRDALRPGAVWHGHQVLKPNPGRPHLGTRGRDVTFQVTRREGTGFEAHWRDGLCYWKIRGTIQVGQISWRAEDVEKMATKSEESGYNTTGNLNGDEMTLDYSGQTQDGVSYVTHLTLVRDSSQDP
jgi:serine/threonine protein kinase